MKDKLPPHRFGPGHDIDKVMDAARTHSLGIKTHPKNNAIAKQLLRSSSPIGQKIGVNDRLVIPMEGGLTLELREPDKRPLIDKLHEATFYDSIGLQYISDKYMLRTLVRKAQRFTLDDETSRMVAEFSIVVARDLPTVRELSTPPFPVTWIDINNVERLKRIKELGYSLTPTAAGETDQGEPVQRVGWLIWPANDLGGYYMIHVTEIAQGVVVSPLAWWWHTDRAYPDRHDTAEEDSLIEQLTFGVRNCGVGSNAFVIPSNIHRDYNRKKLFNWQGKYSQEIRAMMIELSGELRHVFGFLMALAATKSSTKEGTLHSVKREAKGKPLLPLEHKIMHLHLRAKTTVKDVTMRMVTKHKMREHDVRAHLRTLASGRIIKVRDHKRGDSKLGRIVRDETRVEK